MLRRFTILALIGFSILAAHSAKAQDLPLFGLPIDCRPTETCWVMNYVDMGTPDDGVGLDHACGPRTYDGHKGTDIAIRDLAEMEKGVAVLAAADGTVSRTRDTEDDNPYPASDEALEAIKTAQKECGNAVLLDHGHELQTLYCHMKKGSITVQPGQTIKRGDKIGEVGMSGYTQFPHVHFGIVDKGAVIDPFTGLHSDESCGGFRNALWASVADIAYQPVALYDAGFHNTVPSLSDVDHGLKNPESLKTTEAALTFWFVMFGPREGDKIHLQISDPSGKIFAASEVEQSKTSARQFNFVGRDLSERTLEPGTYTGKATVTRKDGEKWILEKNISIRDE